MEGISLRQKKGNVQKSFETESFKKMQGLRLLQLNYVHLTGSYEHISKDLRWLCLEGFPLKFIPDNFYLEDVVTMELRYSNLRQLYWKNSEVRNHKKKTIKKNEKKYCFYVIFPCPLLALFTLYFPFSGSCLRS